MSAGSQGRHTLCPPTHSLPAKVTAIVLFLITLLTVILSVTGIVVSAVYDVYDGATPDSIRAEILEDYLYDIGWSTADSFARDPLNIDYYRDTYFNDDKGFSIVIADEDGSILFSNYRGQAHAATAFIDFTLGDSEYRRMLFRWKHRDEETLPESGAADSEAAENEAVVTSAPVTEDTAAEAGPASESSGEEGHVIGNQTDEPLHTIYFTVRGSAGSLFGWRNVFYRTLVLLLRYRVTNIIVGACALLATVCLFIFLMCASGRRRHSDEVVENPLDRVPYDLFTVIVGVIELSLFALFFGVVIEEAQDLFALAVLGAAAVYIPAALVLLGFFMSTATRVKTGRIWSNTVIWRVLLGLFRFFRWIGRGLSAFFHNLGLLKKTILVLAGLLIINLMFFVISVSGGSGALFVVLLFLFELPALCVVIIWYALSLRRLQKGAREIADGHIDYQIDAHAMPHDCADAAADLNRIGEGLSRAVDERMKSEHFRTELITNVSHDLKTPLTSIVNYVDLIKKENVTEEPMAGYVEVLDRQSARLKKLIEDLVEASKASSGVLAVELAPCELGVLLDQVEGEYREKLAAADLTLIVRVPAEPVTICADGRHLGRVFDNLMNNIVKYAQPGTRVYLDAASGPDGCGVITFRNTSGAPLNIPPEELMERFVRGDASRHTEGSGLGLSIVQSLTELQKGRMTLTIDGDLFKVELAFPKAD